MNRVFNNRFVRETPAKMNPLHRSARQLREDTEDTLRDMAFVLQLTRRVKQQILAENEDSVGTY